VTARVASRRPRASQERHRDARATFSGWTGGAASRIETSAKGDGGLSTAAIVVASVAAPSPTGGSGNEIDRRVLGDRAAIGSDEV